MFILNQKVILPESHNKVEGVVTLVPKQITLQEGLSQQVKRVKVSYQVSTGIVEAWFPIEGEGAITNFISQKDITAELEAKYETAMKAVNEIHDREKLDWVTGKEEQKEIRKDESGQDIEESGQELTNGEILVPKVGDNIVDELAVLNAKKGISIKGNDNSDEYQG